MKLKKCMRDYPISACIGVAAVSFLLLTAVSFLRKQLPESILIDYIRQFINILMPLALALILGYGWAYKRGSFGKTLLAGLLPSSFSHSLSL